MKIIQLTPAVAYGDAITGEVLAFREAILEKGWETEILVREYQKGHGFEELVTEIKTLPVLAPDDILLLHVSIGDDFNRQALETPARVIVVYHNITPGSFFEAYSPALARQCRRGVRELKALSRKAEMAIADSDWIRQELLRCGYTCPIAVLPILIRFEEYFKTPDPETLQLLTDTPGTQILFVGRISPNKCQEDVIAAFAAYKRLFDPDARLWLVGNDTGNAMYCAKLKDYIEALGVSDVTITGKVPFAQLLAFYRGADVFLCQSAHEGFCVPLVESMVFDLPVVAWKSTAVPGTLGGSGIVLDRKDPVETAAVIDRLMRDEELKKQVVKGQRTRLTDFSERTIRKNFITVLEEFIG